MDFDKVLVGVDGHEGGRDAIALGRLLAGRGGELVLVRGQTVDAATLLDRSDEALAVLELERARADVDANLDVAGAAGTLEALRALVQRHQPDVVVLGASHRSALGRLVLGDVGTQAVHELGCPVAIAPAGYARELMPLCRVGVGFDGSPEAHRALDVARELAGRFGASLHALTVVALPSMFGAPGAPLVAGSIQAAAVADAQEQLDDLDGVRGEVVVGGTGPAILDFSRVVDLLVLGTRDRGRLRRAVLGSTTDVVVHHAACPVLIVGPDAADAGPLRGAPAREPAVAASVT